MKTLLGMVTFGNLPFTKLAIDEIRRTTQAPLDILVVIGNPDDTETLPWCQEQGILYVKHFANLGFPVSINDIYDRAFGPYEALILAGNDIVPYPGAIDALIETAERTDWEWICSTQFDSKSLVAHYPEEAGKYFEAEMEFTDFAARPWDLHAAHVASAPVAIEPHQFKDVRNLTLFKRSVFEQIGYADVNFWPGGYFEDNDYARRAVNAGLRGCGLPHSVYFHFWSRTIHQGPHRENTRRHVQFQRNEIFYRTKWGGSFASEAYALPFGGAPFALPPDLILPSTIKIPDRLQEAAIISYWENKTS